MKRHLIRAAVATAVAACAAMPVLAQDYYRDNYTYRLGRAPDWNVGALDGMCRLRIWVDDRAQVQLRGDQIIVNTSSGKRSFDQGSVCTQPLPFGTVNDFRVSLDHGRGMVSEVRAPERRNNFTGALSITDPQNGGEAYEVVVQWHNPGAQTPSVASSDPYPYFDETRACQERVRAEFLGRNRDVDAYLEFAGVPTREEAGGDRERIRGGGWARNRSESRPITYQCMVNDRTNRVLSSTYDLLGRSRMSALN